MIKKLLLMGTAWLLSLLVYSANTQPFAQLSDSAKMSILTCSPGEEIYELFGHTGIRVVEPGQFDVVVNYGLFDFEQDNFIGRFLKGETDYQVGLTQTSWFLYSYEVRGSSVTETPLHLNTTQKQQLWDKLQWNLLPENKEYRYNFIFNNCATQPRDLILEALGDHITLVDTLSSYTFRDAIHLYTTQSDWDQLGFDLCLGMGLDNRATIKELMFLPEMFNNAFCTMQITDENGLTIALTDAPKALFPVTLQPEPFPMSPKAAAGLLFILLLLVSTICYKTYRPLRGLDAVVYTLAALVGCILFFLAFFSEHPFTESNLNLLWANPLLFYPLLSLCIPPLRKADKWFYLVACVWYTGFLISLSFLPQVFHPSINLWIGCLWIRACYRSWTGFLEQDE